MDVKEKCEVLSDLGQQPLEGTARNWAVFRKTIEKDGKTTHEMKTLSNREPSLTLAIEMISREGYEHFGTISVYISDSGEVLPTAIVNDSKNYAESTQLMYEVMRKIGKEEGIAIGQKMVVVEPEEK